MTIPRGKADAGTLRILRAGNARTTDTSPATWVLEWVGERDLPAGSEVELRGANLRTLIAARWMAFGCEGIEAEPVWRVKEELSFNDVRAHNPCHALARFRVGADVSAGARVRFSIEAALKPVAGGEWPVHLAPAGAPHGTLLAGPVGLRVAAGPADRLRVWARPGPEPAGAVRVVLCPLDAKGYPTAFGNPVPVTLETAGVAVWQGVVGEATAVLIRPPAGQAIVRLTARVKSGGLAGGERIRNARSDNGDLLVVSNPVWPGAPAGQTPLFGEIHWHTDISGDGMRELSESLLAARDLLNLDFAAPGDHGPDGARWEKTVRELEAVNAAGEFATLFGWEASSNRGHENYYFTTPDHPLVCRGAAGFVGGFPDDSTAILDRHRDFIAIPHHTNAISIATKDDGSHYWYPYPWQAPRNGYRRLVEIVQGRGNQERETYPDAELWRAKYQGNGGSAQTALAAGHEFGFTGGTDNHTGWPTLIASGGGSNIYTGVWAAARERQAVYDGLHARRTWACWDTRAIVRFSVNDVLQGGELRARPGAELTAALRLSLEAPPRLIEIVSDGDRVVRAPVAGAGLDLDIRVPLGPARTTFFYLRAVQTDGALVYASPVFVKT